MPPSQDMRVTIVVGRLVFKIDITEPLKALVVITIFQLSRAFGTVAIKAVYHPGKTG